MRGQSTRSWMYFNSRVDIQVYPDPTRFDYTLIASSGDLVFANNGRNTDIVYVIGNKVKIRAKNNDNISYSLNFKLVNQASVFANCVISAHSAPYQVSEPQIRYD